MKRDELGPTFENSSTSRAFVAGLCTGLLLWWAVHVWPVVLRLLP